MSGGKFHILNDYDAQVWGCGATDKMVFVLDLLITMKYWSGEYCFNVES